MPRQAINIRNFHSGLVSNPDAQDIPLDACSDMEAVALDGQGKLIGLPTAGSDLTVGDTMKFPYAWIKKLSGQYYLLFNKSTSSINVLADFYNTPSESTPSSNTDTATTMVARSLGVHIGLGATSMPKWYGYIDKDQFNASVTDGFYYLDAECSAYSGTSAGQFSLSGGTPAGSGALFIEGYKYNWGYSLIYDGVQESPLIAGTIDYDPGASDIGKYKPIVIRADSATSSPTSFNQRITGVNLYRAESQTASNQDYGFYKLVESIDIDDTSWATDGNDKIYTYNDYCRPTGASYEDNSGIPETATRTIVAYKLSAEVSGYLFTGACGVDTDTDNDFTDLPDASHMLFRSKEHRYDTFDWANEYVRLPRVPTAMRGYNGQLLVWDNSSMYLIDPNRFYVMDTLDGAGCSDHKSVKVTPYGVFFANSQGAYLYNGKVQKISDAIKDLWQAESATPEVNYDEQENLVLFHFGAECYYYHITYGSWGYTSSLLANFTGAFQGKDGESYSSSSTVTSANFGGASTRAWDWTSKEIDFDTWQDKKWYFCIVDTSDTLTITRSTDGGSYLPIGSGKFTNTGGATGKQTKIKLVGDAGESANRIEIIARVLRPTTDGR